MRNHSEDDESIPVHDRPVVARAQFGDQLLGGPAEQAGQLLGVVVHQSAGDEGTVGTDDVDRLPGGEQALDAASSPSVRR